MNPRPILLNDENIYLLGAKKIQVNDHKKLMDDYIEKSNKFDLRRKDSSALKNHLQRRENGNKSPFLGSHIQSSVGNLSPSSNQNNNGGMSPMN